MMLKKNLIKTIQRVEKLERLENNHISPILSPLEWKSRVKPVHGRSEQRAALCYERSQFGNQGKMFKKIETRNVMENHGR